MIDPHLFKRRVVQEVVTEMLAQDEKWGEQNHPDGTDPKHKTYAELMRSHCDTAHRAGVGTWLDILNEAVAEAMAEPAGSDTLRTELIQVAAVAAQWAIAIDRRQSVES